MQFSEYNPLAFHSISSLYDANLNFQAKHGLTTVETDLKSIIFKHGVQALFGVGLVHRHFDLEKGTILVEKDMVTAPWRAETSLKKHGGKIMPTSWLLWGGQIYPYEFQFLPYSKVPPPQLMDYALFVKEFFDVVKQRGLEQWVGLRRLSGEEAIGMVECTEGNVNIMFSSNEVPADYAQKGTATMWFFDNQPPYRTYRCMCTDTGTSTNPNHNHIDQP